MSFGNRRWVILTADESEDIDYTQVVIARGSLVWNRDESKTFVKYDGSKPSFLSGKTALTHAQILTELRNDEWQPEV